MADLRFAVFGAGFWARYQLAAWREITGARCVSIANRTRDKAAALAAEFGIPSVFADPEALLQEVKPDFVDIITSVESHAHLVELAAHHRSAVICQKPMAPDLATARRLVETCRRSAVPFLIHENWRWQSPLRAVKEVLEGGSIGRVFRARLTYANSFPVFQNQPFLRELDQFILTDMGTHILDTARMLFGEADTVFCRVATVTPGIRGEDVATVVMGMTSGATVSCELSYASRVEHDRFPETYVLVEGSRGSLELGPDFWLRVTTVEGTRARRVPPPYYSWADPRYALAQTAGVPCATNLLAALQGRTRAETDAEDNLKTLELVHAAYDSARARQAIHLTP